MAITLVCAICCPNGTAVCCDGNGDRMTHTGIDRIVDIMYLERIDEGDGDELRKVSQILEIFWVWINISYD